jgi:hypothetical protein
MEKGALIVALGHVNFVKMAINLAISIKANSPSTKIALAHNFNNLDFIDKVYRKNIDYDFFLEEKFYKHKERNAFGMMKTLLYEFTPFEHTLYIDADSLMLKDKTPDRFFYEINVHDFIIPHYGQMNPTKPEYDNHEHWVKFKTVKDFFLFKNVEIMASCQSSIIGFQKSELSKSIFLAANMVYHSLASRNIAENMWFNTVPDELCFWLAHGIVGHTPTYNPEPFVLFSHQLRGVTNYTRVYSEKDIATFPSAMNSLKSYERDFYNLLVRYYSEKTKTPPLHYWVDKRRSIPVVVPNLRSRVNDRFVR